MTRREAFAAAAMTGILAEAGIDSRPEQAAWHVAVAREAVAHADALTIALDHADQDGLVDAIWTRRDTLSTLADSISQSLDAANAKRADTAQAEAVELLIDAMHQGCIHTKAGWAYPGGISTWEQIGEWLVTHADWDRMLMGQAGTFTQYVYRPPQAKEEEA